ncbi:PLP-dependent aminotransferase family protein [Lentibacillus amyloliquefaciens]|uniref:GntR family transcriptional regulator n=1 Tax=Lentibacillus amyloliquefaciens TaxID=1472767 RepID=A0A0U3WAD1_9BACI|nr:PLP-dependent aminotransferase family protein [Lentibacillus amyloliquefaciens]ALX50064.1 GntR family transcriptional regulator [Lentibacillus amyloliquefaciens]
MIKFHIDNGQNSNYIYKQIYETLKGFILDHKVSAGTKLPSKRELSNELGVSINSVAAAYEQLLAEGYIYTVERRGYFIENIAHFVNVHSAKEPDLPAHLKETFSDQKGWLSFSHIKTDNSKFPFHEWMKSQQKAIAQHKSELAEIAHFQGPFTVRKTISDMIALTRGVTCEPEQIIIGTGIHPLIHQLMAMQSSNRKVAVENPGYSRIYQLLKSQKRDVSPIELDKEGIDIKGIETAKPDFLFITPSHQFPTGTIMPISRRVELLNWAATGEDRYIIEDDYDSEFKYGTDNIPSLQSLDRNQRVIYFGTFSKTLLPSFRISYMVLPPKLLELYQYNYSDRIQGCSSLHLYALHYFIQSGEYAKHIKRMNQHYNKKRKQLIKELYLRFQNKIKINDAPAGLHFLAEFNTDKRYEEIDEKAQREKLEIYTIKRFLLGNKTRDSQNIQLVIGFASIKQEDIVEAVERLYRVIY